MEMFKDRASLVRQAKLAAGAGILLASCVLFWRERIAFGFLIAGSGFSVIVMAESGLELSKKHDSKSFWHLLKSRAEVSTLGKLCDIASHFCFVAALISWLVLR